MRAGALVHTGKQPALLRDHGCGAKESSGGPSGNSQPVDFFVWLNVVCKLSVHPSPIRASQCVTIEFEHSVASSLSLRCQPGPRFCARSHF